MRKLLVCTSIIFSAILVIGAAPVQYGWKSAVSGNWSDTSKWNPAALPGTNDTIKYSAVGTFTITNDTGGDISFLKIDQSGMPGASTRCIMSIDMQGRKLTLTTNTSSFFASGFFTYKNSLDMDPPTCTYEFRNGTFDFSNGTRIYLGNAGMEADGGFILSGGATLNAFVYYWNSSSRVFIKEGSVWNWSGSSDLSSGGFYRGYSFLCVTGTNSRVEMNGRSITINNDYSGVFLLDGGTLNCQTLTVGYGGNGHGSNGFVQVRSGMLNARSLTLGSTHLTANDPTLTLAGETTLVTVTNTSASANLTCYERTGATIAFEIPANGYRTNGVARAPLWIDNLAFNTSRSTSYPSNGATAIQISCITWAAANPNATIPLISIRKSGGDKTDLETLTNGLTFADVPTPLIEAGNAPVLSIDEGGTTLSITAPASMSTDPTPPEFTVASADSGVNGVRNINLTINTYGYLSTQATLVELTYATNETFTGSVVTNLTTLINATTPCLATFQLPGCAQRQHYWCRLRVVNDQALDTTVPFEFTDEGWQEAYVWASAADGHWDTLANWKTGTVTPVELPHGEDSLNNFPAGSYTVTLDADSEIRNIGTFSAGTLAAPNIYTFDLNGKTLRTTKVSQTVTSLSGMWTNSLTAPMSGQLIFRNGTFNAGISTSPSIFTDAELHVTDGATVSLKFVMSGSARLIVDNGSVFNQLDHLTLNVYNSPLKTYGLIRVNGTGSKYSSYTWNDLYIGGTYSAVIAENGGTVATGNFVIGGNKNTATAPCSNCIAQVDSGMIDLSGGLNLGTSDTECYKPELRITGTNGLVRAIGSGMTSSIYENIGAKIAFEIPARGFSDTNGTARAPLYLNTLQSVARGVGLADFGATTLEITARDWVKASPKTTIKLIELVNANASGLTNLKNAAVFTDTNGKTSPVLSVSGDGKILYATAPVWPGFVFFLQ